MARTPERNHEAYKESGFLRTKKSESNMNIKRDQNIIKIPSLNIRVVLQNAMLSTWYLKQQLKNAPLVSSLTKAVIRYPSFLVD